MQRITVECGGRTVSVNAVGTLTARDLIEEVKRTLGPTIRQILPANVEPDAASFILKVCCIEIGYQSVPIHVLA